MIPLSVLDLVPVGAGDSSAAAVHRVGDLAQLAERLGYVRYWFAEHHGMQSVASSAPEILIGHVASATTRLRVGSGGIMLPNHAPLRIAEAFRTLSALHPGRIDLGIGRAPGSDHTASRALRAVDGGHFPQLLGDVLTLCGEMEFPQGHWMTTLAAMPNDAPLPPVWILGSSGASAQMAGGAGMGYSFASHFSPTPAAPAFEAYRRSFVPSKQFTEPHTILGVAVVCADTQEEADFIATSMDLLWVSIHRGEFIPLPSPEEASRYPYSAAERRVVDERRALTVIGPPDIVAEKIEAKARACGASEVMVTSNIHDHAKRLRSYELLTGALVS